MAGKITTILAKKEAEAYCSHGLHKEALDIYKNLIATSPNMDPDFKTAIENQIGMIAAKVQGGFGTEIQRLSAADIARAKRGWGKKATEGDLLVCARAFYEIGHYRDALLELSAMLCRGCAVRKVAGLMAGCLARLLGPDQLIKGVEQLGNKIYAHPHKRIEFEIALAHEMTILKKVSHAHVLYRHLQKTTGLNASETQRLGTIAKEIQRLQSHARSRDNQNRNAPTLGTNEKTDGTDAEIKNSRRSESRKKSFFNRWPFLGMRFSKKLKPTSDSAQKHSKASGSRGPGFGSTPGRG
jgi:hypothetical protein